MMKDWPFYALLCGVPALTFAGFVLFALLLIGRSNDD